MSKKKSLTELRADVEKGAQRKKFYENEIKIKEHQIIERPDILSDEQIMKLLTFVFHKDDVQAMLREMIKDAEMKERG